MANELQAQTYQTTGTVYARLWNATGQYWYTVTPAFEAFNAAHIASYALTGSQDSTTGKWTASMPAAAVGTYSYAFFLQSGGSPAVGDVAISTVGSIDWTGTVASAGVSYLPQAAAGANGGLPTVDANNNIHGLVPGTGTGQINASSGKVPATLAATDVTGNVACDLQTIKTETVTCAAGVTIGAFVGNATAAIVVDATGHASINWGDISNKTTTNALTGTTISSSQVVASVTGAVGGSVGSISGVTFPANFGSLAITVGGAISEVVLTDTLTTYTGDTPQSGDSFARIGATGSGLTSLAPAATALSTAQWTTALATSIGTLASHDPGSSLASHADIAAVDADVLAVPGGVWDVTLASHLSPGSTGAALNAAGSSGDPWATALPGAYTAGTAGYIVGNLAATLLDSPDAIEGAWTLRQMFGVMFAESAGTIAVTGTGITAYAVGAPGVPTNAGDTAARIVSVDGANGARNTNTLTP